VFAPWLLSQVGEEVMMGIDPALPPEQQMVLYQEALPGLLLTVLYSLFLLGMSIAGLVLLIVKCRRLIWKQAPAQLPKKTAVKTVYLNVGMILYVLICIVTTVLSLL